MDFAFKKWLNVMFNSWIIYCLFSLFPFQEIIFRTRFDCLCIDISVLCSKMNIYDAVVCCSLNHDCVFPFSLSTILKINGPRPFCTTRFHIIFISLRKLCEILQTEAFFSRIISFYLSESTSFYSVCATRVTIDKTLLRDLKNKNSGNSSFIDLF